MMNELTNKINIPDAKKFLECQRIKDAEQIYLKHREMVEESFSRFKNGFDSTNEIVIELDGNPPSKELIKQIIEKGYIVTPELSKRIGPNDSYPKWNIRIKLPCHRGYTSSYCSVEKHDDYHYLK